ncbi:hypothetical protein AAG570_004098 [Ranatra chinensis]|uniref:Cadherin domain-containing protein n=1 Tax=Ranatra chinensis TaxID=642074 RepID=A0ABD0YFD1_9HEMI
MRLLLLPSDARIGSVIYRLRATDADKDYPLTFAATDYGSYVIRIDNLPCTKESIRCEANVLLERSLVPEQVFKFRMTVRDTKGDTTTVPATIQVTNGVTQFNQIFPHIPGVILIPESTEVGTELEYVIVRRNPRANSEAALELWGSTNFKLQQSSQKDTTTGVITLAAPLDYETKTMYKLSIFSVDQFADLESDSRNAAGFQVVIVVTDVQDTPPMWDHIEPVTKLRSNLTQGDFIVRVTARDGDKGSPRKVKYALVSEGNPFTVFFSIDQDTGDIRLDRPLKELASISRSHQPILVTVVAEEVALGKGEPPAQSSTTTVAFLLGELGNTPPYFESPNYVARIEENGLQGTPLVFGDPYVTEVRDDNMGKQGIFSLELENNNGTFEISPSVSERQAQFIIRVRDNTLLDYEINKELKFKIVARELNPGHKQLSSSVEVTVYISDVNDNPPKFTSQNYTARLPENSTTGLSVITVKATDVDTGDAGVIKYTSILGYKNTSLNLNPDTGLITVANGNHALDREETSVYQFYVEARDMNGLGHVASVPFTLYMTDVNDNSPTFEKSPIEFILGPEGTNFSQRAFIKADDADAEPPNNVVHYEILSGNYGTRFSLNAETGELTVNRRPTRFSRQTDLQTVTNLVVRAYDLGVPTKWTSAQVNIFPAESGARVMRFIVAGSNPDRYSTEQMLAAVTGGRVVIHSITPYRNSGLPFFQARTTDLTYGNSNTEKSIVTATILYSNNAIVDLETLQKRLIANQTTVVKSEPVTVYKSESTTLFWILILLLLLLFLTILTLLLCCLCAACPLYGMYNRKRSVVLSTDHINYTIHGKENKEVQAEWVNGSGRKEAWSGGGDTRRWSYGGGAGGGRRTDMTVAPSRTSPPPPSPHSYHHPHGHLNHRPSVIFTRQV